MPWAPIVGAVVGVAGAVVSGIEGSNAAGAQQDYNAEVQRLNEQYRRDVMSYQNTSYAQDVEFYGKQVAWEKSEFDKTKTHVQDTIEAVDDDMFGKLATEMTRVVENDIASTLQRQSVYQQGRAEMGSYDAKVADNNVGGNSVALVRGDISRQVGNAATTIDMNDQAFRRQAGQEALAIKASHDTSLASITIPTFQPLAPPKAPAPVSPVNPAAPVNNPSPASIALNAISSGINLGLGANNLYNALKSV